MRYTFKLFIALVLIIQKIYRWLSKQYWRLIVIPSNCKILDNFFLLKFSFIDFDKEISIIANILNYVARNRYFGIVYHTIWSIIIHPGISILINSNIYGEFNKNWVLKILTILVHSANLLIDLCPILLELIFLNLISSKEGKI